MQSFELSFEEAEVLRELLEHAATELDREISRADAHDFKVLLKQRKEIVERILGRLAPSAMIA